mgnify:CR=1 FL=1
MIALVLSHGQTLILKMAVMLSRHLQMMQAIMLKIPTNNVPVAGSEKANGITLTFSNLSLGWYLVVSDLDNGAICSIGTTDPNAEINEKNSKPTIEKEVYEGSDLGYSNDAGIGDTVKFQTRIHVTDGNPFNYVLHDTMTKGFEIR